MPGWVPATSGRAADGAANVETGAAAVSRFLRRWSAISTNATVTMARPTTTATIAAVTRGAGTSELMDLPC